MTPEELNDLKRVEFYAASVQAWFNTSLEHDKSLLALSAGGIGLLLTLLTTVGLSSSEALVLYIGAIFSFVVSLSMVLLVFKRNRSYIEAIISGNVQADTLLSKFDSIAIASFGIGVLLTALIGISAAIHSYTEKSTNMATKVNQTSNRSIANESFNGLANLKPTETDLTKSFNGANKLQPSTTSSSTTNNTQASTPIQTKSSK